MTPIERSLRDTTYLELAAIGGITCLASQLLPNVSKKGVFLNGGVLFASSFLYNSFRHDPLHPFSQISLEKGGLFILASLASLSIPPKAALLTGTITTLASLLIAKKTAPSPLGLTYITYQRDPEAFFKLEENIQSDFIQQYYEAGFPPLPYVISLQEKNTPLFLKRENVTKIMTHPEKFNKAQLEWVMRLSPELSIQDDTVLPLLKHLNANNILPPPLVYSVSEQCAKKREIDAELETLFIKHPIYFYVESLDGITITQSFGNPTGSLTPAAIKEMHPQLIRAWFHSCYSPNTADWKKLPSEHQIALIKRFAAHHLTSHEKKLPSHVINDFTILEKLPPSAQKWMITSLLNTHFSPELKNSEDLIILKLALNHQIPLPPLTFKLNPTPKGEDLTLIKRYYQTYPLRIHKDRPHFLTITEFPSLNDLEETTYGVSALSEEETRIWHHYATLGNYTFTNEEFFSLLLGRFILFDLDSFMVKPDQVNLARLPIPTIEINQLSKNQLEWYLILLFDKAKPTDLSSIDDEKGNHLLDLINTFSEDLQQKVCSILYTPRKDLPEPWKPLIPQIQKRATDQEIKAEDTPIIFNIEDFYNVLKNKFEIYSHYVTKQNLDALPPEDETFLRTFDLKKKFPLTDRYVEKLDNKNDLAVAQWQLKDKNYQNFFELSLQNQEILIQKLQDNCEKQYHKFIPLLLTNKNVAQAQNETTLQDRIIFQFNNLHDCFDFKPDFGYHALSPDNQRWVSQLLQKSKIEIPQWLTNNVDVPLTEI